MYLLIQNYHLDRVVILFFKSTNEELFPFWVLYGKKKKKNQVALLAKKFCKLSRALGDPQVDSIQILQKSVISL